MKKMKIQKAQLSSVKTRIASMGQMRALLDVSRERKPGWRFTARRKFFLVERLMVKFHKNLMLLIFSTLQVGWEYLFFRFFVCWSFDLSYTRTEVIMYMKSFIRFRFSWKMIFWKNEKWRFKRLSWAQSRLELQARGWCGPFWTCHSSGNQVDGLPLAVSKDAVSASCIFPGRAPDHNILQKSDAVEILYSSSGLWIFVFSETLYVKALVWGIKWAN